MTFENDIELICEKNYNRRKLEDEEAQKKKQKETAKVLRTAVLACAMAAGGGATFAGMGITMGHGPTIAMGIIIALVFGGCGLKLEGLYDGGICHDV